MTPRKLSDKMRNYAGFPTDRFEGWADEAQALEQAKENLAVFVRRMLRTMRVNGLRDRDVCRQADKYLKAIGATGSVLKG